jgi:hypothetical protein
MKKAFFFCAAVFSLNLFSQTQVTNQVVELTEPPVPTVIHPGEYVPDELLLMIDAGTDIKEIERTFNTGGFVVIGDRNCAKSMRVWEIKFDQGTDLNSALAFAKKTPGIELAQFNHYVVHRSTIPNDASFSSMWDLNNTGQTGGTPDADVDAPEAWDITTGGMTSTGDTIVVAVIDAGFDLAQQDLNFWKNYADIPGNGIDDDNNGYIDDTYGWDAYNSDGNITSDFHGTHVCGTVGARGNNSVGVAGVNWGVQIMGVMGSDGTEAQVVEAYTYVFDARKLYNTSNGLKGAFVVSTNSSFGVDQGQPSQYPLWCAMYDSLGSVGILSAAATANANWDIDAVGDIPTACSSPYMIAVTNTTNSDVKFGAAGFGANTIDLGAPGTAVMSTFPGNTYGTLTGTSMASPHVAGAVALMWAAACPQMVNDYKADPGTLALSMKNYMMQGVDVLPSMNGLCVSNGRLNLYNSLVMVGTYNCTNGIVSTDPQYFQITGLFPDPASDNLQINFNLPQGESTMLRIFNSTGQIVHFENKVGAAGMNSWTMDISQLPAGVYFLRLDIAQGESSVVKFVVE